MIDVQHRQGRAAQARRLLVACALPVALMMLAMLAAMMQTPWALRILAVPVLIVIPGVALVALVFGEREDPALALPMTVLLGLLLWLPVTLILHLAGIRIGATSLAIGVGAIGVCLTIERQRRRVRDGEQVAEKIGPIANIPSIAAHRIRTAGAVICSIAAIAAAVFVAAAIQPHPLERYTSLGFTDTTPFSTGHNDAAGGAQVRLNWALRGYGYDLSSTLDSIRVTVDGSAIDDIAVDVGRLDVPGVPDATSTVSGAVTFAAPTQPGRHVVALAVVPAALDGTPVPEPGFVTTVLEVK